VISSKTSAWLAGVGAAWDAWGLQLVAASRPRSLLGGVVYASAKGSRRDAQAPPNSTYVLIIALLSRYLFVRVAVLMCP
jgi:hypothetical protein